MLNLASFIGRMEPMHMGHLGVVDHSLTLADRLVICVGSASSPRTVRNPWTFDERCTMIKNSLPSNVADRVDYQPISDYTYNDFAWMTAVHRAVESTAWNYRVGKNYKIGLVGHIKTKSDEYQNMFRKWNPIQAPMVVPYNSTDIRRDYFTRNPRIPGKAVAPEGTRSFLDNFTRTDDFRYLLAEHEYLQEFRTPWACPGKVPYPAVFVTVDALVTQGPMILLIERKSAPGKGLLAMPGGFLNAEGKKVDRTVLDGALRELHEETRLKVPQDVLRGSLKSVWVADDPYRSERGRIISHVHHFDLNVNKELPKANGRTDAKRAFWMPYSELKEVDFFEDHFHIIRHRLGLTN